MPWVPGFSRRHERLNRLIQEFLAEIFEKELRKFIPPRYVVTVSEVRLNAKKTVATVFVAVHGGDPQPVMDYLAKTVGYWSHQLAKRLRHHMRRMPELRFKLDTSYDHADKIRALLEQINRGSGQWGGSGG